MNAQTRKHITCTVTAITALSLFSKMLLQRDRKGNICLKPINRYLGSNRMIGGGASRYSCLDRSHERGKKGRKEAREREEGTGGRKRVKAGGRDEGIEIWWRERVGGGKERQDEERERDLTKREDREEKKAKRQHREEAYEMDRRENKGGE